MSSSRSRVRISSNSRARSATPSHVPLTDPGALIFPEGPVSEEAAELIHEFVHPHHRQVEETLSEHSDDDGHSVDSDLEALHTLPWWKRPSPIWLFVIIPFTTLAMSATIAPKVEIYTQLVCSVHKPDIFNKTENMNSISHFSLLSLDNSSATSIDLSMDQPKQSNPCASDPVVQAVVAKLSAIITACMGVLSCLTSAWWGAFSDRHGRTSVMSLSVIGLLFTDFNFILVYHNYDRVPGGYWFLILGPLVEGSLGGMTTAIAAMHAYQADTSTPETRSRVFSLSLGLIFTGMAIGPTLGGILIRGTHATMSVFYAATGVHVLYAAIAWFVIPESLTVEQMRSSGSKYLAHSQSGPSAGALARAKRLFTFLSPLSVFLPEIVEDGTNPLKQHKKDWNLTLVALAYGFTISIMGSYTYKFQYAASTFGWTSETIGYWLSLTGAARALYLTLILPAVIRIFKPKAAIALPRPSESVPLNAPNPPSASDILNQSLAFDLRLVRVSLVIELTSYTLMGLAAQPLAFTVFAMMGAMGTGFSPALQSTAVELYNRRGGTESGRLFGALSVVQALASQIIGPTLYGVVYMNTVATVPRAIFFVSVASIAIAIFLLNFLRIPKDVPTIIVTSDNDSDLEEQAPFSDATLIDLGEEREVEDTRRRISPLSG